MLVPTEHSIPGVVTYKAFRTTDVRGSFVKTYHVDWAAQIGREFELREEFYSVSNCGVVRGMHFQVPPCAHQKLVYCISGSILDVLIDLRRGEGYGKVWSRVLNAAQPEILWVPTGVAHGFLSLENNTIVVYKTDCEYSPKHDAGVRWNSIGFDWTKPEEALIVSQRDTMHPVLSEFQTPF